jgi:hypothetical protein
VSDVNIDLVVVVVVEKREAKGERRMSFEQKTGVIVG